MDKCMEKMQELNDRLNKLDRILSDLEEEDINKSDIIWIISPWLWKKIPKRYLKQNKVVCSVYHFEEKDFERDSLKDFYKRDSYVDEYHVISPYIEKDLSYFDKKLLPNYLKKNMHKFSEWFSES